MTNRYEQILAEKGITLDELGIHEVALRREDALTAIQALRESMVPILGGDVYFEGECSVEPAYANWYVDVHDDEFYKDFIERSFSKAKDYIAGFPERADKQVLFVLVFSTGCAEVGSIR